MNDITAPETNAEDGPSPDLWLGQEMRLLRKRRGLSLEEVAAQAGVSPGLISQIERGLTSPSIRSLRSLAKALDVPVSWFFQPSEIEDAEEGQIVVRAANRRRMGLKKIGVTKELMTPGLSGSLQMMLITLDPRATTGPETNAHEGEKCGVVVSGALDLMLEGRTYSLREGDSFRFDSMRPHFISNSGAAVAKVLWITTPSMY
jgi:transcriptional regulator with XRE-family HTH domain